MSEVTPIGIECRHMSYSEARDGSKDDLILAKEYIHLPDGSTKMNIRFFENQKRPFWVTHESKRKNKYKKESEKLSNVRRFDVRQSELIDKISNVLYKRRAGSNTRLAHLNRSTSLYGTDLSVTAFLKAQYGIKWPEQAASTAATLACFDIETDVINGTDEIICMSVTSGYRILLCYTEAYVKGIHDPIGKTKQKIRELLKDRVEYKDDPKKYKPGEFEKYDYEVRIVPTPGRAVADCIAFCHEVKPDYLLGWNITFDIPRMLDALKREGYDVDDVFCDPAVPKRFRFHQYKPPNDERTSASGRKTNLDNHKKWPMFYCMASFQVMDAMCGYYQVRQGGPAEANYKLGDTLERNKCYSKLTNIKGTEGLKELAWHEEMQTNFKIEYGVYNIWDNQGIEFLDKKTLDYSLTIPMRLAHSDLKDFTSNPKRICDKLFFSYLTRGEVFGCTSDQMQQEDDKWVISRAGHIVTLPCDMMADNGIFLFWDMPNLRSYFRLYVADLDVSSSYPFGQIVLNMSRATTYRELSRIEGVTDFGVRKTGINLISGGKSNAVDICRTVLKAPSMFELLAHYDATH